MSGTPRTHYASRGDLDIAYQVLGDGPNDLVVMPGPFIPIDSIDNEPSMYRFYRRLASFSRVIRFDQRGMGMSSRIGSADTITITNRVAIDYSVQATTFTDTITYTVTPNYT